MVRAFRKNEEYRLNKKKLRNGHPKLSDGDEGPE
jgi:hypothetical protein